MENNPGPVPETNQVVTSVGQSPLREQFGTGVSFLANVSARLFQDRALLRKRVWLGAEVVFLVLWALSFASPYLDFDSKLYPGGVDYQLQIHFNHVWTRAIECGLCAMWNGNTGGGNPAFADIFPATLHPLTILSTLIWGVRNGSKVELFGIFLMAGLAQWWLARVLGLGRVARLWTAAMAVVAGNIVGRMDMGWINVALSTAACALVLPAVIQVSLQASRRAAILLGLVLSMAVLAGQGYMQLGLLLTLPAALVLLPWGKQEFKLVLSRYALAAGLALLVSAPLLLPFATAYPQFGKAEDVDFRGAIHFLFMPLGFVLHDPAFFRSQELGMQGYAALYVNYVGWLPVLFSLIALRVARTGKQFRILLYLVLTLGLAFLGSSLEPRAWVSQYFPGSWLEMLAQRVRSAPVIAGLAVPPLLGLAGLGFDAFWSKLSGHIRVGLELGAQSTNFRLNPQWLLVVPLVWSVMDVRAAGQEWIQTQVQRPETYPVLQALKSPDTQWVYPPTQNFYLEPAIGMGLKIPWIGLAEYWKDRSLPPALYIADFQKTPPDTKKIGKVQGVGIFQAGVENSYALVTTESGDLTPCAAQARAGDIDVHCNLEQGGVLSVKENSWAGWGAQLDGQSVGLNSDRWLNVNVPPGDHVLQFRYRPWDFPLGVFLFVTGICLAIYAWGKPDAFTIADME